MYPASFKLYRPTNLREALELLSKLGGEAKVLAGGQSLIPLMRLRLAKPEAVVYLGGLQEMRGIRVEDRVLVVGALTTHREIEESKLVLKEAPLLWATARVIGDIQVRSMGTIGGSIAHADPAADYGAVLAAFEAEIRVASIRGERSVIFNDLVEGPYVTSLAEDELIIEVRLPRHAGWLSRYEKHSIRPGDLAVAGVALAVNIVDGVVADAVAGITGVSFKPDKLRGVEEALKGRGLDEDLIGPALKELDSYLENVEIGADQRASQWYRRRIARALLVRAINAVKKMH